MENKKAKRFYKVDELVWIIDLKTEGTVDSIDKKNLSMTVSYIDKKGEKQAYVGKMWKYDKIKYKAKEKNVDSKKVVRNVDSIMNPEVFIAKVRDNAIIPSKRDEDAGFDIYACAEQVEANGRMINEIFVPANKTTLVPTGIAVALPETHYLNAKHERGSTGKISMSVLAGVVDSGYRGEIFIALAPLHKDVLITSDVKEVLETESTIMYPYSKAIAQFTIDLVPQTKLNEITYDELLNIDSERGVTKLGESGK